MCVALCCTLAPFDRVLCGGTRGARACEREFAIACGPGATGERVQLMTLKKDELEAT